MTSFIEKIKEAQAIHYNSTKPMDDYFTGFYNGIEYVLCMAENREPQYKDCEKPPSRLRHLESMISGHMEAMRPLLDEWSAIKNRPVPMPEATEAHAAGKGE